MAAWSQHCQFRRYHGDILLVLLKTQFEAEIAEISHFTPDRRFPRLARSMLNRQIKF